MPLRWSWANSSSFYKNIFFKSFGGKWEIPFQNPQDSQFSQFAGLRIVEIEILILRSNLIQTSVLQFKRWGLDDKEGIKWIKFLVFYVFTRFSVTQFKSGTISFLASQSYFVFVKLSSSGHCTVSVRGVKSTIILSF